MSKQELQQAARKPDDDGWISFSPYSGSQNVDRTNWGANIPPSSSYVGPPPVSLLKLSEMVRTGNPYRETQPGLIDQLTFTKIIDIRSKDFCKGESALPEGTVVVADDNDSMYLYPEAIKQFKELDVGIKEYKNYISAVASLDTLALVLPKSDINQAVCIALKTKLTEQLAHLRGERMKGCDDKRLNMLYRAQRDILFAINSITQCLREGEEATLAAGTDDYTYSWFRKGEKFRNGGFRSSYDVCSDLHNPEGDQEEVMDEIDADPAHLWPDEFHYPGKLDIQIDPLHRIQFVYTPEKESARLHHQSHTEVTHSDGSTAEYENESLNIRIDLDQLAPNGIALDIGRSPYDGEKNGRQLKRDGDLLGTIFGEVSPTGCHEYTGFEPGMADEFRGFAERMVVQLHLQAKHFQAKAIGRAVLPKAA